MNIMDKIECLQRQNKELSRRIRVQEKIVFTIIIAWFVCLSFLYVALKVVISN